MTWGQIKREIEKQGVTDDTHVLYIDIHPGPIGTGSGDIEVDDSPVEMGVAIYD